MSRYSFLFTSVFVIFMSVCSISLASRPSPYASYFHQFGQSWQKVAEVTYAEGNIVANFEGCTAVMKPEGEYDFQGSCNSRYKQSTYIAKLKLQDYKYLLYYQLIDFSHQGSSSNMEMAYPRY